MDNLNKYETELLHIRNILLDYNHPVLMQSEFRILIRNNKSTNHTISKIKEDLIKQKVIIDYVLRSEGYKDIERIIIPELNPSPYHFAVSIRKGSYLSHSSSVNILGLTQQIPRIIYVNKEQSPKKSNQGTLTQDGIDRAFKNQQRKSKYVFKIENYQIIMLSGKYTNNTGVEVDDILNVPRTSLERTLIDITVRPRYAGGVFQVVEAFKNSINSLNVDKLLEILKLLDYTYPYHQSLGFYLDKAGADKTVLNKLSKMGLNYDFYLDYSMASPQYDKSWRIYFPSGV